MPKPLAIALTVSHRKKPPVGLVPAEAEVCSYQGKKPPVGLVPAEAELSSYQRHKASRRARPGGGRTKQLPRHKASHRARPGGGLGGWGRTASEGHATEVISRLCPSR